MVQDHRAVVILQTLLSPTRKARRLRTLLKGHETEAEPGWFMAVPPCFNDALDIKENATPASHGWTQSACFCFKEGDVLYDTPIAREKNRRWHDALRHIGVCLHVDSAVPCFEAPKKPRDPGSVTFTVMVPNATFTALVPRYVHTMTQDAFVHYLIAGPALLPAEE